MFKKVRKRLGAIWSRLDWYNQDSELVVQVKLDKYEYTNSVDS